MQRAAECSWGSAVPYSPGLGYARVYYWHFVAMPKTLQAPGIGLVQGEALASKVGIESTPSLCRGIPAGHVPGRR